jgi:hypothetical protein
MRLGYSIFSHFFAFMSCHSSSDRSSPSAIAIAAVLVAILGCNKESRTAVSGTVTFDGLPLSTGQIVFEPTSAGRLGIAQISNGTYAMSATQGPTVGKYVVRITANRPSGRKTKTGGGRDTNAFVEQQEQFIPTKYNDQSELTTEVSGEGSIVRDFMLKSK